jgi:hypothetical protein
MNSIAWTRGGYVLAVAILVGFAGCAAPVDSTGASGDELEDPDNSDPQGMPPPTGESPEDPEYVRAEAARQAEAARMEMARQVAEAARRRREAARDALASKCSDLNRGWRVSGAQWRFRLSMTDYNDGSYACTGTLSFPSVGIANVPVAQAGNVVYVTPTIVNGIATTTATFDGTRITLGTSEVMVVTYWNPSSWIDIRYEQPAIAVGQTRTLFPS